MNNIKQLETVTIEPSQPAKHSIIWLHGLGADGNDFASIVPALQLPTEYAMRFIFPHAPMRAVTINNGMSLRAWFDLYSLENLDREDSEGIAASDHLIRQLIQQELDQGIAPEHVFLAGFSQGGAMALHTGLRYPKKLAGILALSTYLPQPNTLAKTAHSANQTTPIMMAHGAQDPVLPILLGEKSRDHLKAHHYPVAWHAYPMAHEVCLQEIADISDWMMQCIDASPLRT